MATSQQITPVLLCGGSGTRLWPLSRRSYPKQFSALIGEDSLFQASVRRVHGKGFAPPVIVTGDDFRFIVTQQLAEAGIDPDAVILEPAPRNTAPAVLAALLHITAADPGALVLIAPSDHVVSDTAAFHIAIAQAALAAQDGAIVTFGIRPDRPETGYGYLELGQPGDSAAIPLLRFVEKPDHTQAAAMLAD
ncbi:sugar phosphate nucleotidyltransferase, partial [Roseicyclus sp.]|uniref:sugar phosphate nucleotidyltransferase n=1 Tax=Roseicyclus sp. TaxID=1914329 RepID=UPI003F6BBEA5